MTVPFTAQDPKAIDVVQYILEQCLLRREKNMKDKDGKPIVDLPLKTVRTFEWYLRGDAHLLSTGYLGDARLFTRRAQDL